MTSATWQLLWLIGLGALVIAWARQLRLSATVEPAPVPRAEAAAIALLVAALGAGGAAAWGGLIADEGLAGAARGGDDAPARARLFLRHVQLFFQGAPLKLAVGYGEDAALVLPRDYGLDEAGQARDVFTVEDAGPRALRITPVGGSRVLVAALRGGPDAGLARATALLTERGRRCRTSVDAPPPAPGDAVTYFVLLCSGAEPRALLAFERELGVAGTAPADTPLRVTPYVYRPGGFRPHHVHVEAGTLMQIGAGTDALPGVTLWEIPAPAGRPGLMFPPRNLLADCSSWLEGNAVAEGGFFYPGLGVVEPQPAAAGSSFACVLPFTPPFALEVRRLLPDTAGVWQRSLWAAALMALPCVLALLIFAVERGSVRSREGLARFLGLAVVAVALTGVGVTRLLLAHRLDMMRDYEPAGVRVGANELLTVLVAAALAGAAVALGFAPARRAAARAAAALVAWAAVAAVGAVAVLPDAPIGPSLAPQVLISLLLALSPLLRVHPSVKRALVLLAVVGLALALSPARAVVLKLGVAWALPAIAVYVFRAEPRAAFLVAVDLALLARLDTGVSVAIAGVGLLLAVVGAAQDALYTDADARSLDAFARYRPLLVAQAGLALAVAALVGMWAALGISKGADIALPQTVTRAALHGLGLAALLFGGIAAYLATQGQRRRAVVWGGVAVVLLGAWLLRERAVDRVLAGRGESAARVAAIVDPAYALLADDRAFAKGLTAWRETAADADLATGQGFFGAQVLDPGVLLSIENDYLPILLLRERGAGGLARLALLSLGLALALGLVGAGRFAAGSSAARARRVLAGLLGLVALYQPVAALGALPFTGVTWPGLGIDSPSDLWIFVALLLYLAVLGDHLPRPATAPRRARHLLVAAAAAVTIAGVLLAARVGVFALRRGEPVERHEPLVKLLPPFDGLEAVFDYAYRMQCAPGDAASLPRPLLPDPSTPALARYHAAFVDTWEREAAAARAVAEKARAGDLSTCDGDAGHWSFDRRGDACRLTFKLGWPQVTTSVAPDGATCDVDLPDAVLRAFRYPPRRPYAGARIRLTSRALGDAAKDRGELLSGRVVVRLRPGAGIVDVADARAEIAAAEKVSLGEDVEVFLENGVPKIRRGAGGRKPARVLTVERAAVRVHLLEPSAKWATRVLDPAGAASPLDALSVIVVGGVSGRNVWLFRPPGAGGSVDPLLADDVTTVLGSRRRHYVYGGQLPELGWVNPGLPDKSLGLDGWTHAAVARWERDPRRAAGPGPQERFAAASCGTLAPPPPDPEVAFARVCSKSPLDDVLECRVSLQPELETRLRHLLELSAARPELFAGKKGFRPAVAASFALLRGDTGEIVAQGTSVPGRESTAYAPGTPSLEKYLLDARAERDETGAEKADWPAAVAVGSTMKPLLARALELAAPDAARGLVLTAAARRSGCEPIFGHCPPTLTLWNHTEHPADLASFVALSMNWFQAAIGLYGTALPDGEAGFGDGPAQPFSSPIEVAGASERLWTRNGGRDVIRGPTIDASALRATPLWRQFEALLGRPLCLGDKASCQRAADRRDLCAARALPVDAPSPDLRHLVAIGPSTFDFSDGGKHLVKEYLQLLRGSGKHPLASTLQLADAFNRLFFEAQAPHGLAASWFPVDAAPGFALPARCGRAHGTDVAAGLCRALQDGTAAHLASRLDDPDVVFYGGKTGTIDSLGDIVENRAACAAWNRAHTIAGASAQPYWLDCDDRERGDLNDSLFVVGFGVKQPGGAVLPFTLALRYQRVGTVAPTGYAVHASEAFIDLVADYFDP